jgi:hypothetical protein
MAKETAVDSQYGRLVLPLPSGGGTKGMTRRNYNFISISYHKRRKILTIFPTR